MAEWKKVIVSGSDAHLNSLLISNNQQISGSAADTFLSGSFSGSFQGFFEGVTNLPDLTEGEGIAPFIYDGASTATIAVSGAAQLADNAITKWDDTDGKFVNSSLTDDGTAITGTTSIQLTGANSSLSGSFSGSFQGDGSAITGVSASLILSSLDFGTGLAYNSASYNGSQNIQIAVSGAAQLSDNTVVKWNSADGKFVDTNITDNGTLVQVSVDADFQQDVTISGDLTVQGTASFQNTQNLLVADRFVLFASGSNTTGDGGIVVQQGTQNVGELFGYDSVATRWGFTSSFAADSSGFAPVAYVGAVQTGTGQTATSPAPIYGGASFGYGTIHVDTDDSEIWIYA